MFGFPEVSYITNPNIRYSYSDTTTVSDINSISPLKSPSVQNYDIVNDEQTLKNEINKIWEKLNKSVSLVHNCANCGATLEIKENKPVFHCKYCGSTYLVGTAQIYSNY